MELRNKQTSGKGSSDSVIVVKVAVDRTHERQLGQGLRGYWREKML